jgi:hypothetical protein
LLRSSRKAVHLLDNTQVDDLEHALTDQLRSTGIKTAYVDYLEIPPRREHIESVIGRLLGLARAPYAPQDWTTFSEDIAALAQRETGLAIVIDNAEPFLSTDKKTMLKLIEAFQTQLVHWLEQGKPCHLFFQMEKNDLVRRIFRAA